MKILITAGTVYGRLDDNKLVGNRSRGIWAVKYAGHLSAQGHQVTLLVADTFWSLQEIDSKAGNHPNRGPVCRAEAGEQCPNRIEVMYHNGFDKYRELCWDLAPVVDAAVMASAVVNWIPAEPIKGKMPTKGFKAGDRINIPFYLAPHVIDEMKTLNPKLALIGCKMTAGSSHEELIEAAYGVVLRAKCNVVVANDLSNLRAKYLVYQDRTVQPFGVEDEGFYETLDAVLADQHFRTEWKKTDDISFHARNKTLFDRIVTKYRGRLTHRVAGEDKVFGAVVVWRGYLAQWQVSPREKGQMFTSADSVWVERISNQVVHVIGPNKATLNAPLLIRVALKYGKPVLHLHEQLPGVPTVPYAPPGTVRDSHRDIPGPVFNIEGHGFIACLDPETLEIVQP